MVIDRIDRYQPPSNVLTVDWNLGKRCNLACPYCSPNLHDNHSKHFKFSDLKIAVDNLVDYSNTVNKNLKIQFTGGEPTINPDFGLLLKYIKNFKSFTTVTSNGTRKPEWFIEHKDYIDSLIISLHFEKNWERVIDNIFAMHFYFNHFTIHLMAHHDYYDDIVKLIKDFKKVKINFRLKRIRWNSDETFDTYDDSSMYDKKFELLFDSTKDNIPNDIIVNQTTKTTTNKIAKSQQNMFENWMCMAGVEGIHIYNTGDVYLGSCKIGGSIGNIYQKDSIKINHAPVLCDKKYCVCLTDIAFTKWK
jgi:MoaA/NifB/PqqE/SkfB family radical SAM enzyme